MWEKMESFIESLVNINSICTDGEKRLMYLSSSRCFTQSVLDIYLNDAEVNDPISKVYSVVLDMINELRTEPIELRFCVNFLTKLLKQALSSQLPTLSVIRGFGIAVRLTETFLNFETESNIKKRFLWTNTTVVLSVVQSRILSHSFFAHIEHSPDQLSALATCMLQSFLAGLEVSADSKDGAELKTDGLSLHFQRVAGPPLSCWLLRDAVAMDIPRMQQGEDQVQTSGGLVVALFDCSLEMPVLSSGSVDVFISGSVDSQHPSLEIAMLDQFADLLQRCEVNLVGCQRRVHPYLLKVLRRRRIQCLPRVSARFMLALQRLSGARQLGSFLSHSKNAHASVPAVVEIDIRCLGRLVSVRDEYLFGRRFVVARGRPDSEKSFHSLVVTAESEQLVARLQDVVQDVHRMLWRLSRDPWVLPGHWRSAVAHQILGHSFGSTDSPQNMSTARTKVLRAVHMYAHCLLETLPSVDAEPSEEFCVFSSTVKALNVASKAAAVLLDLDDEIRVVPQETDM